MAAVPLISVLCTVSLPTLEMLPPLPTMALLPLNELSLIVASPVAKLEKPPPSALVRVKLSYV